MSLACSQLLLTSKQSAKNPQKRTNKHLFYKRLDNDRDFLTIRNPIQKLTITFKSQHLQNSQLDFQLNKLAQLTQQILHLIFQKPLFRDVSSSQNSISPQPPISFQYPNFQVGRVVHSGNPPNHFCFSNMNPPPILQQFLMSLSQVSKFKCRNSHRLRQQFNSEIMYCLMKNQCGGHTSLGEGSSGSVKLAMDVSSKQLVAIKTVFSRSTQNELAIHSKLHHPNIVELKDFQVEQRKTSMILEYVDGGSLREYLYTSPLEKSDIRAIFGEVCEAVGYLHDRQVIHGDIKTENILLTKNKMAKLCDFGSASLFGDHKRGSGTLQYMPPEVLLGLPQDQKVDIWALGILLFQLISGTTPFPGSTKQQIHSSMKKTIPFSNAFTSAQIDLIKSILRVSSHKRPAITAILEHRFFSELKKSSSNSTVGTQSSDDFLTLPRQESSRNVSGELETFRRRELERLRRQLRFNEGANRENRENSRVL